LSFINLKVFGAANFAAHILCFCDFYGFRKRLKTTNY